MDRIGTPLYSEIDQIHLSIEAQCGTACLPMGDCHTGYRVNLFRNRRGFKTRRAVFFNLRVQPEQTFRCKSRLTTISARQGESSRNLKMCKIISDD